MQCEFYQRVPPNVLIGEPGLYSPMVSTVEPPIKAFGNDGLKVV